MTALDTPDPGPVFQLPERAALDPESAGALALSEVLPPMLEPQGVDGAVAIDYKLIARTVLAAVGGMPRVPPWEEPRTIGGASRGGGVPDPEVTVEPRGDRVRLVVTTSSAPGQVPRVSVAEVPPADARPWFLAGLAAVAAAEAAVPGVGE